MAVNALIGKPYANDPLARMQSPQAFKTYASGDLNNTLTDLLPWTSTKIRVAVGGDLVVLKRDNTIEYIPTMAAGETIVIEVAKVMASGTAPAGSKTTACDGITVFFG